MSSPGNFNKVEIISPCHREGFRKRLDAKLFSVGSDEANLTRSNAVIDPRLLCSCGSYGRSLQTTYMSSLGTPMMLCVAMGPPERTNTAENETRWA